MKLIKEIFDSDFPYLDQFHDTVWVKDSGISDFDEMQTHLFRMKEELRALPKQQTVGRMLEFIFDNVAVSINPRDPFGINVGCWIPDRAQKHCHTMGPVIHEWQMELFFETPENIELRERRLELHGTGALWSYPDTDHAKPNWADIIDLGIPGLLRRVKHYRDEKLAKGEYSEEMKNYYEPIIVAYEAFIRLLRRSAEYVKAVIGESDKMPRLYSGLCRLADGAPRDIYEVMLLTFVYSLIQEYVTRIQTRTLGNVDTLWRPFYKKALASGTYTRDELKQLIKYFYLRYEYEGHPNAQPMHLGGTDGRGNSRVNDLSYLMLEAYEELNIISPKLQLAISEVTPDEFILKACDMLRSGHTSVVFANEDMGRIAHSKFTDDADELADLSLSGCYNFSLKENVQPESVGISLVKGVELALNDGTDPLSGKKIGISTGSAEDIADFEGFYGAYIKQTFHLLDRAIEVSDFFDNHIIDISPAVLYSANFEHSVSLGKDVYHNGSKHHNTCITFSCIASAADSLYAVKKYVFDNGELTLPGLRDILKVNWEGSEPFRLKIARDKEKYGNNVDAVDGIAVRVMRDVCDYIYSKRTPLGQHYAPDGEGITHGIAFGKKTGATPDGRLAGDQLSKNLQAVFGCDVNGVTAYLKSATKIDATQLPNGAPIDIVLHPTAVAGERGLAVMLSLIRTTFKMGGSAIQGNVYDAEMLKDAKAHPEKYKGLQVRLCGWSQYFNKLSSDEKDMLIRQAESAS